MAESNTESNTSGSGGRQRIRADVPVSLLPGERPDAEPEDGIALCLSGGGYRATVFHLGSLIRLREAGLLPRGAHRAHALHTPYWWLRCAVGPTDDQHPLVKAYHQVLLWDIVGRQPMARVTKLLDRLANPIIGKSIVVYARKPEGPPR